jgi:hypothetical protein
MVIETGGRFLRVQIKSTMYLRSEGCYLCRVRPCKTSKPYCRGEFDFVAAHVIPEDVRYIISAKVVVHGTTGILRTRATRRLNTKRTERRGVSCVDCPREGAAGHCWVRFLAVLGMTISEGESKTADQSVGSTLGQNALASSLKFQCVFQCVDGRPERSLA